MTIWLAIAAVFGAVFAFPLLAPALVVGHYLGFAWGIVAFAATVYFVATHRKP